MTERAGPALKKLDVAIARLRLLLADVAAREANLQAQRQTFLEQHEKLIGFSLYGDASLDTVLAMLADVAERLGHVEATLRLLSAVRTRAEAELESLQLTKGIEEAKALLSELQAKQTQPEEEGGGALTREEIAAEIARLQSLINEASERAARTIEQAPRRLS